MFTENQYLDAFLASKRKVATRGKLLDAHMRFPQQNGVHVATATQLAKDVGYPNFNSVNLQYGLMARDICATLGVTPDVVEADSTCWLSIFVEFDPFGSNSQGHWELKLRPEVANAWAKYRSMP